MNHLARSAALVALLGAGIASGIGLTTVLGGAKSADPCFGTGAGSLDRVITAPEADGGKKYNVCSKLGQRVIFDAQTGEVVDVSLFEDQLVDYYKQNPDQNPRIIAEKTYDAESAVNSFTQVPLPAIPRDGACPVGAARIDYAQAGVSVCQPETWKVIPDIEGGITIGDGSTTIVGVFPNSLRGTVGTKCARPQEIGLDAGIARLCAMNVDAEGGQGHGIIFPSGREGGFSFLRSVSDEQKQLGYLVAFSVREIK